MMDVLQAFITQNKLPNLRKMNISTCKGILGSWDQVKPPISTQYDLVVSTIQEGQDMCVLPVARCEVMI